MSNQCPTCKHFRMDTLNCAAFPGPEGIPAQILRGQFDHKNEWPGDNGIRWTAKDTLKETS